LSQCKFSIEAKQLKQSLRVVFDRFEKSDPDVQRGILRQLVEKITVFKDNKIEVLRFSPNDTSHFTLNGTDGEKKAALAVAQNSGLQL
jgi:hypothetical protein